MVRTYSWAFRYVVASSLLLVSLAAAGVARAEPADPSIVPDSYIVTLRGGDPGVAAAEHRRNHHMGVRFVYRNAEVGYAATMSAAEAGRLRSDHNVASVVPDRYVRIAAQTVPAGIKRVGGHKSTALAGNGSGSVNADIAILDTGIDTSNTDLNIAGGTSCVPGTTSYNDGHGHGTHVAGIAAAKDNGSGAVGVAPGARLWSVRVLDASGVGTWSSMICGIDWVAARSGTIEVANMSLAGSGGAGSCKDGGLRQSICKAVAKGVTFVAAAGNSRVNASSVVPANFPEVIAVSAIVDTDGKAGGLGAASCSSGADDKFASFSNYGSALDLAAPGGCVVSTKRGGGLATMSGTSMASPHVAGAAALYLSRHPGTKPSAVRSALRSAGTSDWSGDLDSSKEPLVRTSGF